MHSETGKSENNTVIDRDELLALVDRIVKSGELGRSKTYAAILNYLVDCSIQGIPPKEMAIAVDVLGREADFDVGKDSIVRVHIYHLRNKLENYFKKYGHGEKYWIAIPKGQYLITSTRHVERSEKDMAGEEKGGIDGRSLPLGWGKAYAGWGLAVLLLALNLLWLVWAGSGAEEGVAAYRKSPLWAGFFEDESPVLIVVGDYYIFGEREAGGDVARLIRDFNINSRAELADMQRRGGAGADNYINLNLSYIPTSTAVALSRIAPLFAGNIGRLEVKTMSALSTADLAEKHIIYLGYLSGLGSLETLMFAASRLYPGVSYDELYRVDTEDAYFSNAAMPGGGEAGYRDYSMLSSFPSPGGKRFLFITGMRDAGLINISRQLTSEEGLKALERAVPVSGGGYAVEALYEVAGYGGATFDASLEFATRLETEVIWETRLESP